jgi:hypothetical protein
MVNMTSPRSASMETMRPPEAGVEARGEGKVETQRQFRRQVGDEFRALGELALEVKHFDQLHQAG